MQVRRGLLNNASRSEGRRATFASIASGDKVLALTRFRTQPRCRVASRQLDIQALTLIDRIGSDESA